MRFLIFEEGVTRTYATTVRIRWSTDLNDSPDRVFIFLGETVFLHCNGQYIEILIYIPQNVHYTVQLVVKM